MIRIDIPMSKNCTECKFFGYHRKNYYDCLLDAEYIATTRRPKCCPLIEVEE